MSVTTTTTLVPEYLSRLDALDACTRDRDALYRWLLGYPTLQAAWDACENGAGMCWLLATLAWKTPWNSSEWRRFHGLSAEILISLARPFSSTETDAAIDGMIDLLARSERGEDVSREVFEAGAAWAAEAAGATWAAWAAWAAGAAWAAWAAEATWAAWAAGAAEAAWAAWAAEATWAAWAAGAVEAARAARAASLSACADIVRARYPDAPELPAGLATEAKP